ncbi:MAG: EamA family transporter [Lachnospiraceae bacterium]|nr:EamA family transporter [Lachnospiraceae bacterium]
MWIIFAVGSSFFAGITAILAKCGIRKTDSDVAAAIRTVVVLLFSWLMVLITGSWTPITQISGRTLLFLVLSGLATGASWLCYFHALQIGDINKVVPIDKSSTVLTILLALIFLHEGLTWSKAVSVVLIGAGTLLMISKKEQNSDSAKKEQASDSAKKEQDSDVPKKDRGWMLYAVLSAVFASLTAILGKIGISGIDSNLGTAIRTTVVLVMAWLMVFVTGKQHQVKKIEKKELGFIGLSGLATGASWLCYYRALQEGPASVVVPIDKLSILVTIAFSRIVFHEKLTKKATLGVACITVGTVLLAMI